MALPLDIQQLADEAYRKYTTPGYSWDSRRDMVPLIDAIRARLDPAAKDQASVIASWAVGKPAFLSADEQSGNVRTFGWDRESFANLFGSVQNAADYLINGGKLVPLNIPLTTLSTGGKTGGNTIMVPEGTTYQVNPQGIVLVRGNPPLTSDQFQQYQDQSYISPAQRTFNTSSMQSGANSSASGASGTASSPAVSVYRDYNNNFYVVENGVQRHIELPEFQSLGINETFVTPGSTVSLQQAQTGQVVSSAPSLTGNPQYDAILGEYQKLLDRLMQNGQVLNPNVEITPEKMAEFMTQARSQIDPYYQGQAKVAKDNFLRALGYSQSEILDQEKQIEQKYGLDVRSIADTSAETGFALSGKRQLQEQQLANATQSQIDAGRRKLAFDTGNLASQQAMQYGLDTLTGTGIANAPRVLAGSYNFQYPGGESPLYSLSPDVYNGLISQNQNAQVGAEQQLQRQLATDYTTGLATAQQRALII